MKVYEAIAQSLIAEGLTDFFGLMGDGNMWLWGALCRNPSVKPYNARHRVRWRCRWPTDMPAPPARSALRWSPAGLA